MNDDTSPFSESSSSGSPAEPERIVRVFGVGNAGCAIIDDLIKAGADAHGLVPIHTDPVALARRNYPDKLLLESKHIRGLGSGGDPALAQMALEDNADKVDSLMIGMKVAIIISGLGGGTGSGAGLALAKAARKKGLLTLAFVATPFECEGDRRMNQARASLEDFRKACDGVIHLPNQNVFEMLDANTSIRSIHTFLNRLHAEGISSLMKMFSGERSIINLTPADLAVALKGRRCDCRFAHAEATGEDRVRDAVQKLVTHPMLGGAEFLSGASEFVMSLSAGSDLSYALVHSVRELLLREYPGVTLSLGTCEDTKRSESLGLTLIAIRKEQKGRRADSKTTKTSVDNGDSELLLDQDAQQRPPSQMVPPPPELTPELRAKLGGRTKSNKAPLKQASFDEELLSKGRFDQTEPNIRGGEDLDVPTYIRKRIFLN